ncbi:MAG: signal peptidase [Marmoricola sp.]|nr:signal peptidase [Marmoricola sp.]
MSGEAVGVQRSRPGRRIATVVAVAVTVAISAVLVVAVLVPRLAGATPYVILTGSMRPQMPPGTLVVTRPVAASDVGVGEVITYQLVSGKPTVVTHRVVAQGISAVGEQVFRTRGDANTATDVGWVRAVQIRGARWYAVPYLGYLTNRFTATDRRLLQTAVEVGLLGYAAVMLGGAALGRRTRTVAPR